jgi:hypothetical protein
MFSGVGGHVVMVAVLPQNIGGEEAIAAGRAAFVAAAATNRFDGYEIWDESKEGAAQVDK